MERCTECWTVDPKSAFCPLSDEGEGPHQLITIEPEKPGDRELREFLTRVDIHHEQGAQER